MRKLLTVFLLLLTLSFAFSLSACDNDDSTVDVPSLGLPEKDELPTLEGIETPHSHIFSTEWKTDGANHWHECSNGCGEIEDSTKHTDSKNDTDYACDDCGYVLHKHVLVEVPEVPATCEKPGNNKYYACTADGCDKVFFKDAEGKDATTEATITYTMFDGTTDTVTVDVVTQAATN